MHLEKAGRGQIVTQGQGALTEPNKSDARRNSGTAAVRRNVANDELFSCAMRRGGRNRRLKASAARNFRNKIQLVLR